MNRIALLFVVCALAAPPTPGLSDEPKRSSSPASLRRSDSSSETLRRNPSVNDPEPSGVYGYISLVDPDTGRRHLILSTEYDPPIPRGCPDYAIVFRSLHGAEPTRVEMRSGAGLRPVQDGRNPPAALLYNVRFLHDRNFREAPTSVSRGTSVSPQFPQFAIRYNPDMWRFDRIEMGPYEIWRATGRDSRTTEVSIPLTARRVPFSDRPDIGPYVDSPR